jgi:hypothetical protein
MPFASIDEAWGQVKPYVNYNPIINQTNTNVPIPENNNKNNMIRVANELPINSELNTIKDNHEKLESKMDYNIDKMNQDLRSEIDRLNRKIDSLIKNQATMFASARNNSTTDFFNKNIHDILLFMIFGLFTMLVFDAFFKVIKMKLLKK